MTDHNPRKQEEVVVQPLYLNVNFEIYNLPFLPQSEKEPEENLKESFIEKDWGNK